MSSSKNKIFEITSFLSASNNDYINEMYKKFINKDDDLPNSWKNYFKGLEENKDQATDDEAAAITEAKDKLKKLLENEDIPINDLKLAIEDLTKASQSFAEKLYADAQNDTSNTSSDESDDVVEGEVIEDE